MKFKVCMIIAIIMLSVTLTACTEPVEEDDAVSDYIDLIRICSELDGVVFYDSYTGVMYYQYRLSRSSCGLTPIFNTDGTPKIYEGWKNDEEVIK